MVGYTVELSQCLSFLRLKPFVVVWHHT